MSKKDIVKEISKRLDHKIHHIHITNIVTLLVSEIIKEIISKKKIHIDNLFTILLHKTKPRKYHNVVENKMRISIGKRAFKLKLPRNIKKMFTSNLRNHVDSTKKDQKI